MTDAARPLRARLARAGLGPIAQMGAGSMAVSAVNLAVGALTARALGPEGRGELLTLTLYAVSASHALIFGLDVSLAQFLRRHAMPRANAIALAAGGALFAAALAAAIVLAADAMFDNHALDVIRAHFWPFLAFFATAHVSITLQGIIVAEERYRLYTALRVAMPLAVLAGVAAAYAAGLGLWWVFLAYVAANFAYPVAAVVLLREGPGYDRHYRWDPALLRRFGGSAAALHVAQILELQSIAFVVTLMGASAEAGIYAAAFAAAGVVVIFSEALQRYAFGSSLGAKVTTAAEFRAWVRRLRGTTLWCLGASVAVAGPLVWFLIPYVFGADFAPARLVVVPLMVAALIGAVAGVHAEIAKGQGLAHLAILPKLASAAVVFAVAGAGIGPGGLLTRLCVAFILAQAVQLTLIHLALARHMRERQ